MKLQQRIKILSELGKYIFSDSEKWTEIKLKAEIENPWFTQQNIEIACKNIAQFFLKEEILNDFASSYNISDNTNNKKVGIVMAGNIPLVGFHDLMCVFLSGKIAVVKTSSKDHVLMNHIIEKMIQIDETVSKFIFIADRLNNCDAYIATGSNNSAKHFEYYFSKSPNIIRRNRTSVAILTGNETEKELENLADDIYLFFGLGCRNVTKLFVPKNYNFVPLLNIFKKYNHYSQFHKFKNNYDYQLSILILNNQYYMTNNSIILTENNSEFSPISMLHYEFYDDVEVISSSLSKNNNIQCIVGSQFIKFGESQSPNITDFADGVNTMKFLQEI